MRRSRRNEQTIPGMPAPRRIVRQSMRVCRNMGMADDEALRTIMGICTLLIERFDTEPMFSPQWLYEVQGEADRQWRSKFHQHQRSQGNAEHTGGND